MLRAVAGPPTSIIFDPIRRCYEKYRYNNPHANATMASPPTVTLLSAMPVGFVSNNLSANLNLAYATGGDPIVKASGYQLQVVSVVTSGNISSTVSGNSWRWKFIVDSANPVFQVNQSGSVYRFIVDSGSGPQYVSTTGTSASNGGFGNYIQLGFGSRAVRRIWVESSQAQALQGVGILPDEGVYPDAKGRRGTFLGDSIWANTLTGASTLLGDGVGACFGDALGLSDCRFSAVGGTGVLNPGTDRTLIQRLTPSINPNAFTLDAPPSDFFVIGMGTNDANGSYSYAQLVAGYTQLLQLLQAQYPSTPIIIVGCPPGKPAPQEWPATCDLAIQTAVNSLNSPYILFLQNASRLPALTSGSGNTTANTNGAVTMTAAPSGATSATLTANFTGPTGNYKILFTGGSGSTKFVTLTNGSTAVSWSGAVTDSSTTLDYQGLGSAITGALTLTAGVVAGATSATLASTFGGAGGFNSTAAVQFSSGEVRQCTLTNGSTSVSWTDPLNFAGGTSINWWDTTTGPGPNDIYYSSTSGAHPVSTGALQYGNWYADMIYNALFA